MQTIETIFKQIHTEAIDGGSLGSIDRLTVTELIDAEDRFPESLRVMSEFIDENMEENYA